jgi:predicted kinase
MTKETTMKKLTIMRGLPGSGKSTLAKTLANGAPIFSTDDLFMVDGEYVFQPSMLAVNHTANQRRAEDALRAGTPHVVVDNTNTQAWEAREYVRLAVAHGYTVEFVEPTTAWAKDPVECAQRCAHGVPEAAIVGMLARWEKDLTVPKCLVAKAPWER